MRFNRYKILAILWCVFLQHSIFATEVVSAEAQSHIAGWVNAEVRIVGRVQRFPELLIAIKENETLSRSEIIAKVLKLLWPQLLTNYKGELTYPNGTL
jgi:hypothetical protein